MFENGKTCLQAIQMLNAIPSRIWVMELTKELCSVASTFIKKRTDLSFCNSPILFCALAAEFLTRLSTISV